MSPMHSQESEGNQGKSSNGGIGKSTASAGEYKGGRAFLVGYRHPQSNGKHTGHRDRGHGWVMEIGLAMRSISHRGV